MKSTRTDIGAKEAAETNAVQLLLCLFRPMVIQLNAIAVAVCTQGEPKQGIPCSTARVNQIDLALCGKDDAVGDVSHMREVRGVMSQTDIVHQAPDDRGVCGLVVWEGIGKTLQYCRQLGIVCGHQGKSRQLLRQISCGGSQWRFQFHQERTGPTDLLDQIGALPLQQAV